MENFIDRAEWIALIPSIVTILPDTKILHALQRTIAPPLNFFSPPTHSTSSPPICPGIIPRTQKKKKKKKPSRFQRVGFHLPGHARACSLFSRSGCALFCEEASSSSATLLGSAFIQQRARIYPRRRNQSFINGVVTRPADQRASSTMAAHLGKRYTRGLFHASQTPLLLLLSVSRQ